MNNLSLPMLILVFTLGAAFTWGAGIILSKTTDVLDERLGLGQALGGMILLALAGSLPELAITVSAALNDNLGMAAGNLIGGIAVQTLVLAICDAAVRGKRPLSAMVSSLLPVLEALLVIQVVGLVILGAILPSSVSLGSVSPASIAIVGVWALGLVVLNRSRRREAWRLDEPGAETEEGAAGSAEAPSAYAEASTARIVAVFAGASAVTLVAGVVLERSGDALAAGLGLDGVVFGATVLAAASALPEISTGIAAVRLGDYGLVMSDIFGGNAFQVCLFLLADLIAGSPTLPSAGASNIWLAGAGILLTVVYGMSIILRPQRRYARLGLDSWTAIAAYAVCLVGLWVLAG